MNAAIWNKQWWTTATDARMLDHILKKTAQSAGFQICDEVYKDFEPYGHTALWLLAESHLAVHTFPECGKSYIELSSCIKTKFDAFVAIIEADEQLPIEAKNLSRQPGVPSI